MQCGGGGGNFGGGLLLVSLLSVYPRLDSTLKLPDIKVKIGFTALHW
jgi:hypothetical protein